MSDAQKQLDACRAERAALTAQKIKAGERMNQLNAQVRGRRVPTWQYDEVVRSQAALRTELAAIECKIVANKARLQTLSDEVGAVQRAAKAECGTEDPTVSIVLSLNLLAKKYQDFAGDTSRIASMRSMAARFAEEIRTLIRSGRK
jgi:hypothetical protein